MENKNFYDETGSNWTATDKDTNYDPTKMTAEAIYVFLTPEDAPAYEIHRWLDAEGQKQFSTIRYNATGHGARLSPEDNWVWKHGKGDHPDLLYRAKELRESDPRAPVAITEGEKDAETLRAKGMVAVTNPYGSGNWQQSFSEQLKGRDCIIYEDNDENGRKRTAKIRRSLRSMAKSVSVVRFEDMPVNSDVTDFFEAGGTLEELKGRVEKLDELIFYTVKTKEMVVQIENQLIRSGAEIFQYMDGLYRVIADDPMKGPLHRLNANGLLYHISEHCNFAKFETRGRGNEKKTVQVPAKPTKELAELLLTRLGYWQFRKLKGVRWTPLLRENGEVAKTPGYDPESQFFLILPPGEIVVGDTRADAEAALDILNGLLREFPIAETGPKSVDLAVLTAGLLTGVARPSINVAPMTAVRAGDYGAGKSYHGELISKLALGKRVKPVAFPSSDEEAEKRLGAAALSGDPIICIDNANDVVKGDFLAQIIERPSVAVRILGKSEMPEIENNFMICVNGVNTLYQGDLVRRTVLANLDPNMDQPETRKFEQEPLAMIEANREKYLGCALTIMKAYIKHVQEGGDRVELSEFNSFGQWSRMVREPLVWLGMGDPVASIKKVREEDPELLGIKQLFAAWPEREDGDRSFLAADLISRANKEFTSAKPDAANENGSKAISPVLLEIAGDGRGSINPKRLGHYLRKITGRTVGKQRLMSKTDPVTNSKVYTLETVEAKQAA
ncbi:hypothetical protein [Pelagibacterium halotolerans]|uniref:Toprim domain-containing protein n=1 Tax=Pelagibacterium halotolerans (strain DSM 22347 / JCM 15775 / CGMCC 1.7692 / B2) TaxID=1082931 RepID=G4RFT9_PELHB|nr:hypothetical protein [Pelagibacterium halotolerans]AEQ50982.1 hypothetical protein KKY_946 [Pelagibacterium halotolerans B2]QJR19124.1 hypothetical protein HKM20_12155 [Pelagibacterium halotolerans]SEA01700.1 putative DNA primase/helicase [Pelagibacterium halotolerans]